MMFYNYYSVRTEIVSGALRNVLLNTQTSFPARYLVLKRLVKAKEVEGRAQRADILGVISQAIVLIIITPFNTLFVEDHFLKKAINPLLHANTWC